MRLLLAFTLLSLSSFKSPAELYGSYRMAEQGMILNLNPGDEYTLFVAEVDKKTGLVTSRELSRGMFNVKGNMLTLSEQMSNNTIVLRVDSEKLIIQQAKEIDKDSEFLCWTGYYEDGNPRFEGNWRKGKKHGNWVFYDEQGNIEKTQVYKKGKLKN